MKRHVVVTLNKGWGEQPEEVQFVPRDGERFGDLQVNEPENGSMVQVRVLFVGANPAEDRREVKEYFNSFRLDRVRVDGDDE